MVDEYADEPRTKDRGSDEDVDSGLTREKRKSSFGWHGRSRRYQDGYDDKEYHRRRKPYKDEATPPPE